MIKHHISFKHALDGIFHNLTTQPNFRVHLVAAMLATLLSIYLQISQFEWLIIMFTVILVLTAEMLNTSIEAMVDLLTTQHHQSAKIAKDTAAGMVLIAATGAIIVGAVIFLPKIINL